MSSTRLSNRYEILRVLGDGGFGKTYLAQDTQMPSGRACVVKQLKPIGQNSEIYQLVQERFQREAAILEDLGDNHEQIPRLYANFSEERQFYLVQEYIEGETLGQAVKNRGPMTEVQVQALLESVLGILEFVHGRGIIHRDIKPDNIILRQRDSKPVLIDFGAVKETLGTVMNSQGETTKSIVVGTPGFMPSEQAAGRPVYSSDLYSIALTAIYLLTARFPQFLDTDPHTGDILWQSYAPHVSQGFADVLTRAIQFHPRDRFPNAQEMRLALYQCRVSIPPTLPYQRPQTNPGESPQRLNFQSLNQSANSSNSQPQTSAQSSPLKFQTNSQQTPQSSPSNPPQSFNSQDVKKSENRLDFQEFKAGSQASPPPTTVQNQRNQPLNFGDSSNAQAANAESASKTVHYAGFWRRCYATLIDAILVSIVFNMTIGLRIPESQMFPVYLLCDGLYRILMESSVKQGTIGKIVVGLVVVDLQGKRLNRTRASIRYIASWVSWMTFGIGFVMAGWTRKKQALHDIIADSLVVLRRP